MAMNEGLPNSVDVSLLATAAENPCPPPFQRCRLLQVHVSTREGKTAYPNQLGAAEAAVAASGMMGAETDEPSSTAAAGKMGAWVDGNPEPPRPVQVPATTARADQLMNSSSPTPVVCPGTPHRRCSNSGIVGPGSVFCILASGFVGLALLGLQPSGGGEIPLLGLLVMMTQYGFVALLGLLSGGKDERKCLLTHGEGNAATNRCLSLPAADHQVVLIFVPLGVAAAGFAILGAGCQQSHHPAVIPALLFFAAQTAFFALLRALLIGKITEGGAVCCVLPVQASATQENSRFTTSSSCSPASTAASSSPASTAV